MKSRLILIMILLPLSACDDVGFHSNDRSGAPRGTFSHAGSQPGNGAPERGELEKPRFGDRSQRPVTASGGGSVASTSASTIERDPQADPVTGQPSTP